MTYQSILKDFKNLGFPAPSMAVITTISLTKEKEKRYSCRQFDYYDFQGRDNRIGAWILADHSPEVIREITRAAALLGVKNMIFIGAGNFPENESDATIHLITDHINVSGNNPLIGPNDDSCGTRFPDMTGLYDVELGKKIEKLLVNAGLNYRKSVCLIPKKSSKLSVLEKKIIDTQKATVISTEMGAGSITAKHLSVKSTGLILSGLTKEQKKMFFDEILLKI